MIRITTIPTASPRPIPIRRSPNTIPTMVTIKENSYLIMDVRKSRYLDNDIIEILDDFRVKAAEKNIDVKIISERGTIENPDSYQEFFAQKKIS